MNVDDNFVNRGSVSGTIKDSDSITLDQGEYIKNGLAYVNIHTNDHPDGEIRGQILTTSQYFKADITGSQEAPTPVTNTPYEGSAEFSFDYETNELKYRIKHDVEDVTDIHIHGPARIGDTADPIIIFDDVDESMSGTVELTAEHAFHLRSGLLYVNIHSETNPAGEIRGQIVIDEDGSGFGKYKKIFIGTLVSN